MQHGNDQPNVETPAFKSQLGELADVRRIQEGYPDYTAFLTRFTNEDSKAFKNRKERRGLFDAVSPTIANVVGKILRTDPVFGNDVSEAFLALTSNIDNRGQGFTPFMDKVISDALWSGHSYLFIDHTTVDGAENRAQELELGSRPYWLHVRKDDVPNFHPVVISGVTRLGQASIREVVTIPDHFGVEEIEQYRVLRRRAEGATWQLYRKPDNKRTFEPFTEETLFRAAGNKPLTEIPLVPIFTRQTGFMTSRPKFIELAHLVICDYLLNSDILHNHHLTSFPTPVFKNLQIDDEGQPISLGGTSAILTDGNGGAEMLEASSAGIEAGMKLRAELENKMRFVGLRIQESKDLPDRQTAASVDAISDVEDVLCQNVARQIQDATETAMSVTEQFLSGNSQGGTIKFAPNESPQTETETEGE